MSKSKNQKLLDAALLIHENCKEHISKDKCHKCLFGLTDICILDPPGEYEPHEWGLPQKATQLEQRNSKWWS